jgi:D-alanyl-D-alanine carboxypeptidase
VDLPRQPAHRPGAATVTLIGHAGATGSWLFHCPELDVHLPGTLDQATLLGRSGPFRLMARMLRVWGR